MARLDTRGPTPESPINGRTKNATTDRDEQHSMPARRQRLWTASHIYSRTFAFDRRFQTSELSATGWLYVGYPLD